jgi:hypothetical protein
VVFSPAVERSTAELAEVVRDSVSRNSSVDSSFSEKLRRSTSGTSKTVSSRRSLSGKETKVCVNPTQVCVNPTQVCVNPTQVCVNPTQVCVNPTQVCVNPTRCGLTLPRCVLTRLRCVLTLPRCVLTRLRCALASLRARVSPPSCTCCSSTTRSSTSSCCRRAWSASTTRWVHVADHAPRGSNGLQFVSRDLLAFRRGSSPSRGPCLACSHTNRMGGPRERAGKRSVVPCTALPLPDP